MVFREAFVKDPELSNLLLDEFFRDAIHRCQGAWRDVISKAVECGIPTPAFSTALAFYDGYRAQRSPANLIQVLGKFLELSLFSERSKFTLNCVVHSSANCEIAKVRREENHSQNACATIFCPKIQFQEKMWIWLVNPSFLLFASKSRFLARKFNFLILLRVKYSSISYSFAAKIKIFFKSKLMLKLNLCTKIRLF